MSLTYSLEESLQKLQHHVQELSALQEQELQAVIDHEHALVATLTDDKVTLLNQISELDSYLSNHPDLSRLRDDPELANQVSELQVALDEVKRQSQVNEQVVKVTLSRIEQLRDTLIRTHRQDSVTYDGKGRIR